MVFHGQWYQLTSSYFNFTAFDEVEDVHPMCEVDAFVIDIKGNVAVYKG